jgi:exodeoxyribonuclease VII large subunit
VSTGRPKSTPPPPEAQLSFEARFAPAAAPEADDAPPPYDEDLPPEARGLIDEPVTPVTAGRAAEESPARPAKPRVLAVSELVRAARVTLEARFADVYVEGEISGLKRSGNGHLYFCLKDAEAQVDCVMFSREAGRLRFRVADGLQVRVRGRLTIYEGRGKFQLSVMGLELAGAGALAIAFEQLKQKLAAEGLFDPARKRRLPFLPRRIGVVTSPQGAVIRDIVRVALRRCPVRILLAPAPVQGEGASIQLAWALRQISSVPDVDVVIVARGGGSLEDLWAFNEEPLARAIVSCRVPVISAVGHETDFTISDFVADVRAPTPSAAAELVVPVAAELSTELQVLCRRLARGMETEFRGCRLGLERARARLGDPRRLIDQRRQALDDLITRGGKALRGEVARKQTAARALEGRLLRAHPQRRIADQRAALVGLERRMGAAMNGLLARRRRGLDGLLGKVETLSPLKVLERGYSLARTADGHLLASAAAARPGEPLTVTLHDGDVQTRVEEVHMKKGKP